MVVVAGDERHLLTRTEARHQAGKDARSCGERVTHRVLAQLDDVTEQDQMVDLGDRSRQRADDLIVVEPAAPIARADVQVRDD